jgi:GT2 family glycosyltransferase
LYIIRQPVLSVIIVNYNGESLINGCLKALERQTFQDFETIIVDNNSSDKSLELIETFLNGSLMKNRSRLIALNRNLGFAGGNIEGLRYVSGRHVALLNNDTEPREDWLQSLLNAMVSDSRIGICASKLIASDNGTIDSAGDGYTRALRGFKRGEGDPPEKYDTMEYVFGACAGAALYNKAMLDEIGFFDEDFFLIHEDTDLNFRAKLAGWKAVFVPGAIVYHKVTSSIGYMSRMQVYYTVRNSEFVRIKNIPLSIFLLCLPEFVLGLISEFVFFGVRHGYLGLFLRAKGDAARLFPRMLKKRREIMKNRTMSSRLLLGELTATWNPSFVKTRFKKLIHG